jgi:hypothetical protein
VGKSCEAFSGTVRDGDSFVQQDDHDTVQYKCVNGRFVCTSVVTLKRVTCSVPIGIRPIRPVRPVPPTPVRPPGPPGPGPRATH